MRLITIILLILFSVETQEASLDPAETALCDTIEVLNVDTDTAEGRVIRVLYDSGYSIPMIQILLAQAKLESGNFKNNLTRKWNNVFAMLHSGSDPYSQGNWGFAEQRSGYAVYSSIEESVSARIWYSRKWSYPMDSVSPEEYVRHMKRKGYFTASEHEYIAAINRLIKQDAPLFENKSVMIVCN